MDKTSKSKKIRWEITFNVKNADMDQTMNNKKNVDWKNIKWKKRREGHKRRR